MLCNYGWGPCARKCSMSWRRCLAGIRYSCCVVILATRVGSNLSGLSDRFRYSSDRTRTASANKIKSKATVGLVSINVIWAGELRYMISSKRIWKLSMRVKSMDMRAVAGDVISQQGTSPTQ